MTDSGRGSLFAARSIDVTPPSGLRLGGYGRRHGPSTGVHDALMANLLWLRGEDGSQVAWVTLDALAVDLELSRGIAAELSARLGIDGSRVLVCASHTHSGPAGWSGELHPSKRYGHDPALRRSLIAAIGRGAEGLAKELQPVEVSFVEGPAPGIGSNRNDPNGPHDATAGVLAFVAEGGRVAGALVDHACHPTVLGEDNLCYSADWPGAMRRVLRVALASVSGTTDELPVVGFMQGAAGDISTRFVRRAQDLSEVSRLGALCAAHALSALLGTAPENLSTASVAMVRASVRLPTRALPDPDEAAAAAETARRDWEEARSRPPPEQRIALTRYQGAELAARMAGSELPAELELPVSIVRIGACAWVHVPVELFASLGLEVRAGSPFAHTRVVGYTDEYFGYVCDEQAEKDRVYEALSSVFDATAGLQLRDEAIRLLEGARG